MVGSSPVALYLDNENLMTIQDNSKQFERLLSQRLIGGMNAANEFVIDEARGGAPVKSGDLRDGTEVIQVASQQNPVAAGASKMPYAHAVNRHNTPFFTTAWLVMKHKYAEFFRRG